MYARVREYGDPKPKLLPAGAKQALWSKTAGLVVSPNTTRLPPEPPRDNHGEKDYTRPRLLDNANIYMAWYPRTPHNRGEIFGRLDVTPQVLLSKVVTLSVGLGREGNLQYTLEKELQDSWELDIPVFPSALGYRNCHRSPAIVVRCAIRAQQAFTMLGALLSFVLSLWVNRDVNIGYEPAFHALLKKPTLGITRSWLSLLSQSYVCTLSLGFRAGGIFDPYNFEWGWFLRHFIGVGVPIWFVWGHSNVVGTRMPAIHDAQMEKYYYPPPEIIELAKEKTRLGLALPYEPPTLLHSHYELDFHQEEDDHAPPQTEFDHAPQETPFVVGSAEADAPILPPVEYGSVQRGSIQRHGEDWREFFKRMSAERERWISKETAQQKQGREAREKLAAEGLYTKGSAVFIWRHEQGFYRRESLTAGEVELHWDDYTIHQRVYTSHLKHWDLVDLLPPYPEGDDDDDNDDIFGPSVQPPPPPPKATLAEVNEALERDNNPEFHAARDLEVLLDEGEIEAEALPTPDFEVFLEFLRLRFGYDAKASNMINWTLHSSTQDKIVKKANDVVIRLGYSKFIPPPQYENSLIDFHNTLVNDTLPLSQLSMRWDVNPDLAKYVDLRRKGFKWPPFHYSDGIHDPQDWVVTVSMPTLVLFIFRNVHRWNTLEDIVRLLLGEGMPFAMPKRIPLKQVGLGARVYEWTPTRMDYEEYRMQRKAIFQSEVGRGFRMMGGCMWRLASGQVSDDKVLLGPRNLDHIMARFDDNTVLVEDEIPPQSLEVVCGIYYVDESRNGGTVGQPSWWPKWVRWEQGGFDIGQWTPDAEIWFGNRLAELQSGTFAVHPQTLWRKKVRRYVQKTQVITAAGEKRAGQLIRAFFDKQQAQSGERPNKRPRH
ncbi:hypothetical protein CPB84DRAFT_1798300 [Gymnopilus junonius]|uniref:Uncharacterized protein n=1 Tax=Gymnopilus junonius TaxID=109634 RepID=A0A9P5TGI8_GYMJU|nr:hypothetical protein CPB84DRAFT_1798300 [Gymnopilus junonius]